LPSAAAAESTPSHAALAADPVDPPLVLVVALVEPLAEPEVVEEPATTVVGADAVLLVLSDPQAATSRSGITPNVTVAPKRRSTESPFGRDGSRRRAGRRSLEIIRHSVLRCKDLMFCNR
jgi:hypothetical protein